VNDVETAQQRRMCRVVTGTLMMTNQGESMYDRIRIIAPDGRISVIDKSFSQMVEMLKPLPETERKAFWAKQETKLPSGHSVILVREGV
jgi:hypothetical protein